MTYRYADLLPIVRTLTCTVGATCAVFATAPVSAAVRNDNNAELVLTIWDPVAKASYSKDLGISVLDFFNTAQPDAGYQNFWRINSSDKAFEQLKLLGTATSSLLWAVIGADGEGEVAEPEQVNFYTTLRQGNVQGQVNPRYLKLTTELTAGDISSGALLFAQQYVPSINNAAVTPYNTGGGAGDFGINGSIFALQGQSGYFDTNGAPSIATGLLDENAIPGLTNFVGKSSWFYKLYSGSFDTNERIVVDEFDNLKPGAAGDGYFGLAIDPANGDFVLSYTLESALASTSATTFAGQARARLTEYRAMYGHSRLIFTASDEFSDYAGLSLLGAVPEPTTWLMSLAGLLALVRVVRQRQP